MQINAISKIISSDIIILNGKEVFVVEFLVPTIEGFRETRIFLLHQLLNTNVFHNVHKLRRNLTIFDPVKIWGEQGMTHLVSDEEIINDIACPIPVRESQNAGVNIEAGSLYLLVLHHKVLSGKQFGKL